MRYNRDRNGYGGVQVSARAATADPAELVMMLFDGLIDTLDELRGHIEHDAPAAKSRAVAKATRIVIGLQGSLDFAQGGELAQHLDDLYTYVVRRLVDINAYGDVACLREVRDMMSEIRDAWRQVPAQLQAPWARAAVRPVEVAAPALSWG